MYNYFMLIGYVSTDVELKEVGNPLKKVVKLNLAVQRDFKNPDGQYDTDFFRITLWDFMAQVCVDNLTKGSKIGIKGRMVPVTEESVNGYKVHFTDLIGERVIFFDSKKPMEISIEDEEKESDN